MKKNNFLFATFLFIMVFLLLGSCKKKEEDTQDTDPDKETLLVKDWHVIAVSSNEMGINPEGFSINFMSNGSFKFNTPGIPGLPQSGTWAFIQNGDILLNGDVELSVGVLNASRFVFDHSSSSHKDTNVQTRFELE